MYVSNSFKKYDGYEALKILEVILILNIQKTIVDSKKYQMHKLLQPCPINTHLKFDTLPTGSVKVECSPPERKVVS